MRRALLTFLYRRFPVGEPRCDQPYALLPGAEGIRFPDGTVFRYGTVRYWFFRYTHS